MTDQQEFPPEVVEAVAQRLFAIDWSSEWAAANHQQKSAYRDKASEALAAVMPSLPALGYRRVGEGECVVPRTTYVAVLASLSAAVSLLERGGKQGAPSNKMFGMMLEDYRRDLAEGRAMLAPDETTRRAVEAAARGYCCGNNPAGCQVDAGTMKAPCCARFYFKQSCKGVAAFLDAMGQDIAARRVRRCLNTNTDEGGV
jgi:hypothetical protein